MVIRNKNNTINLLVKMEYSIHAMCARRQFQNIPHVHDDVIVLLVKDKSEVNFMSYR